MKRAEYFRLCLNQPVSWLRHCAANPGPYMRPRHVALIRLAVRSKTAAA
jgi:hypothetical protein